MKMVKKWICGVLTLLLLVSLCACNADRYITGNGSSIHTGSGAHTPSLRPTESGTATEFPRYTDAYPLMPTEESTLPEETEPLTTTPPATGTVPPETTQPKPEVNLFEGYDIPQYRTRYTLLTEDEQYVYRQLRKCVLNDTYTCTLPQVEYDRFIPVLERAAYALYTDFPEFFWISYAVRYSYVSSQSVGDLELSLWCNSYWHDVTNRRAYINAVMSRAQDIADQAMEKYSTDFERLRFIHDYITTNVTYDHEAAAMLGHPDQTPENMQAYSTYGALVRGYAICEGYAKTFKLIANLCGYDCEYAEGDAGGRHAWNYITLNGHNYWVDVTWDDPNSDINPAVRQYTYFGINSQRLYLTHTPDTKFFDPPVCSDTTFDFFHYTQSHFDRYDFGAVKETAREQATYGMCVNLRFDTPEQMQAAIDDLLGSNYRCSQLELYGKKVVLYYSNWTHNVLTLVLQQ